MAKINREQQWIGGVRRPASSYDTIRSPYDGEVVGEVALSGAEDMENAIAIADEAFPQSKAAPTYARVDMLEAAAARISADRDRLAELISRESGKPIRFSRGEVDRTVITFRLGADVARSAAGEVMPLDLQPRATGVFGMSVRVPRGPVAAISPFNFPLNLIAHKLSPAFAVGAPVVVKPPPQSPLTAFRMASHLADAGVPGGWLSILHCVPPVAEVLATDDRMRVLSFTGSDTVGWHLANLAFKKRVLLELGGNAPCIVDETANLADALPRISVGAWANAGQVCIKVQRVLVHRSRFDEFLGSFVADSERVACGDPLDVETVVGPLIDESSRDRVMGWIAEATEAGASIECGGDFDGNLVAPTVITNVNSSMKVVSEEVFGPVTTVEVFDDFDDALARCNQGRFGLQAGVFTSDVDRAMNAARELNFGGVVVNDVPTFRMDHMPYGGTGDSGIGREGVRFAAVEFTEPKLIAFRGRR